MSETRSVDRFLVLDAHCDSLIERLARGSVVDLAEVNPRHHVDLPRLRRGGFDCLFCMVGHHELRQSSILIDAAYAMCAAHPTDFALCRTAAEVRAARAAGQIAVVLTIEGQRMFADDLTFLRNWHRLGVRVASLTHGEGGAEHTLQQEPSFFGYVTPGEREEMRRKSKGLTPFAREALAEMGRLGMAVDVAHCSDASFWQVMERATGPVSYTHGACYALCPHARCLTDEMMRALAARGGVVGIAFCPLFIDREHPTLDRLCDHFLHALEVVGPAHVGIGTDYDGMSMTPVPDDPARMDDLFQALARRGVDDATLRAIAGESFLRLLEEGSF